jgi:DNA-binding protein H-NS
MEGPMANLKTMSVADLLKLQGEVESALSDKRKELEKQLALLPALAKRDFKKSRHHLAGKKVAPVYRSLKDPSLTWASRGQKPKWLVEEMKATKKKLDAFKIKKA